MTTCKPKLLLHFDINKTLIISDSAGGKTVQDICTTILMQSTWGTICEEPQNVPENTPDHFKVFFRWKPFTTSELSVTQLGSNTYNFDEFMEKEVYPYPKLDTLQAQLEANKQVKDKRRQIIKAWCDPHLPGYAFAGFRQQLLDALTDSKTNTYVNIVPAFFELILHLLNEDYDFQVLFRTFGDIHDISIVGKEFNTFCMNQHPHYRVTDPKHIAKLKAMSLDMNEQGPQVNQQLGFFYTFGEDVEKQTVLVVGTADRPAALNNMQITDISTVQPPFTQVITGYKQIYQFLTHESHTKAISDFYYWWNSHQETCAYGKLFLVQPQDTQLLQVFFDDNIVMPTFPIRGIVNLRNVETGAAMDAKDNLHKYLLSVDALHTILNNQYFVQLLKEAEAKFAKN